MLSMKINQIKIDGNLGVFLGVSESRRGNHINWLPCVKDAIEESLKCKK